MSCCLAVSFLTVKMIVIRSMEKKVERQIKDKPKLRTFSEMYTLPVKIL